MIHHVKYWEIIARNIKRRGWSLDYVSVIDSNGRTIWIADAHRDDGKRFVVRADEKLTAFLEMECATRGSPSFTHPCTVKRHSESTENVGLKSHRTHNANLPSFKMDSKLAVDVSPLGSSPLPDPAIAETTQRGEKKGRTVSDAQLQMALHPEFF